MYGGVLRQAGVRCERHRLEQLVRRRTFATKQSLMSHIARDGLEELRSFSLFALRCPSPRGGAAAHLLPGSRLDLRCAQRPELHCLRAPLPQEGLGQWSLGNRKLPLSGQAKLQQHWAIVHGAHEAKASESASAASSCVAPRAAVGRPRTAPKWSRSGPKVLSRRDPHGDSARLVLPGKVPGVW